MTELHNCAAQSFPLDSEDDRCTMSGSPMPGYRFQVIDPDTGAEQPFGTPGELLVHGYGVMQGYYKKPDETAKAIDTEGWMHTGDRAIEREDGTIRFLGRYKDMLKVGGENVDAAEVEALVLTHDAIAQVAVVGVPDERLSEVACACVLLKPHASLSADELISHCRGKVATFKIPKHVIFMDAYPMTSSGKVQKFKLRDMALENLAISTE
jgi:acyl-CoA synthetase (AMP-forming)/AMP-acid ligase II